LLNAWTWYPQSRPLKIWKLRFETVKM
jgi:hypothetical protein